MEKEKKKEMKPSGSTELTEEEKELVKERLRQLGYL